MVSEAIQLSVLLLFIAVAGIVGDWRRTKEQLDASCDEAEKNADTPIPPRTDTGPPSC